jgi:molecular chaperone DnaK
MQTMVEVHVLQGEREIAGDNKTLGKFHLTGIPPAPRGVPQIEVTFDIDANGIVNVSARDRATGHQQSITITGSGNLDKRDIDQMVKDAEAHASEDRKHRELIEARNSADSLAYQLEKTLKDLGDKVSDADKKPVEDKIRELREAAKGEDAAQIRSAMDAAQQAFSPLATRAYEAAAGQQAQEQARAEGTTGQATTTGGGPKEGDDVIDAEFTAEDEK